MARNQRNLPRPRRPWRRNSAMPREKLVIIGAGMAAGRVLDHLMAAAPERFEITLFNAEPRGTYNRIMLSPILAGEAAFDDIITHDADWYAAYGIATRFGERVTGIDRQTKTVHGEGGSQTYDKLVIATGSAPVMIPLPGHDLNGVIAYRDLEDTQRMACLGPGARAVVIGGGLLGLEAAAGMAARGVDVTVVHLMDHLMERQLDAEAAGLLQASLEGKGITVHCAAESERILGENGEVRALKLKDGRTLPCDLLVMAVGIRPSVSLGAEAGLKSDRAIEVDDQMRTSDPDILAVGECVQHQGMTYGLVAPLFDQARVAANTLLDRPDTFVPKSLSTKLKVTGCDLFSAGDFADGALRENILYRDGSTATYKRLVIENDRLVGAVIYGDTSDSAWFFELIEQGVDIGGMRETLIFGPSYNDDGGPPVDPLSAVAASPREARCNGLVQTETGLAA